MCRDNSHNLLKYLLVFACALCELVRQMSQICSKTAHFLFTAFFGGHFHSHSNSKCQINTRYLDNVYCSNKIREENAENNFYFFSLLGGQNSLLTHVPFYFFSTDAFVLLVERTQMRTYHYQINTPV